MLSSEKKLEKERYHPISKALNAILSEFRDKAYGDIPVPEVSESEEVAYMPNDPVTIESSHLRHRNSAEQNANPMSLVRSYHFFARFLKGKMSQIMTSRTW